jgi:hypothetical protein
LGEWWILHGGSALPWHLAMESLLRLPMHRIPKRECSLYQFEIAQLVTWPCCPRCYRYRVHGVLLAD